MNELTCEMCGSNNIIKQDGLYVCQACGTKYSPEEAKKMMQGDTVEVEGTVKIDQTSELNNLYELARRTKNTHNSEDALNYYDQILIKDPNSWEAQFYVIYFRTMKNSVEIDDPCKNLRDNLDLILNLVKDTTYEGDYTPILQEIYSKCLELTHFLFEESAKYQKKVNFVAETGQKRAINTKVSEDILGYIKLMFNLGDSIRKIFGNEYVSFTLESWKSGVKIYSKMDSLPPIIGKREIKNFIENKLIEIQEYEPDYIIPKTKKSGCYVATSVYGSYECPEVWTLRRFRDNTLKTSIFGRLFIKCYYATSPTLVKYFGDKKLFNKLFKPVLDRFVKKLNNKGVKSSFYIDK